MSYAGTAPAPPSLGASQPEDQEDEETAAAAAGTAPSAAAAEVPLDEGSNPFATPARAAPVRAAAAGMTPDEPAGQRAQVTALT